MKRSEERLQGVWETTEQTNTHIMGVTGIKELGEGRERLYKERTAKNVPSLGRDIDIQIQENQRPSKYNQPQKVISEAHYGQTVKSQKQR